MAFFEFPHTRTYDGDLSYILHLLKEIFDNFADTRKDVHFKKNVEIDGDLFVHGNTQLGDDPNDSTKVVGFLDADADVIIRKHLEVEGPSFLHDTAITGDLSATGHTSLNLVDINNLYVAGISNLHNTNVVGEFLVVGLADLEKVIVRDTLNLDKANPGMVVVTDEDKNVTTSGITHQELGTLAGIDTSMTIEERFQNLKLYEAGDSIEITEDNKINFTPLTHAEIDSIIAEVFTS